MVNGGMVEGTLVTPAQLGLAVVLNLALWLFLRRWLARQLAEVPRWLSRVALLSLGLRLLFAIFSGFFPSPDVIGFESHGWVITRQLWAEPGGWLQTLAGNELHFEDWHVVFYGMSNTFFFHKLLSLVNLFTLNGKIYTAAFLSFFCFVGSWQLVRTLLHRWPGAAAGAAVAFLLWPPMLFWTSTYTKESVLLGTGAWLLALVVEGFYGGVEERRGQAWARALAILLLAFLHFKMRYFFAAPLLVGLLGLGLVRVFQRMGLARQRWSQVLIMLGLLGLGAFIAPQLSVAFRSNKFTSQMIKVYTHHLEMSRGRPHFEYPNLKPTEESAVLHMPLAVVNALARPVLGESRGLQYVAGGLENAALLFMLALPLLAAIRRKAAGPLPFAFVLALLVFCVVVAVLMGLTVPNFGALSRYRSAMLPYLLLLLLQNEYAVALLRRLGLGEDQALPEQH
ncbi:hypothetical protein GCM10023185_07860 [Hymenobacter saemangeumensis]|uniref:Glycosyltransferase RgtA/B/C/D-like domain-containing protein n=2 Tax=Hymenobacter saemangeumensis TaxID=1084522 RepID=A0ABP8I2Y1_9BACT